MALKKYKPTSPGRRFQSVSDFADITTSTPEKSLLAPTKSTAIASALSIEVFPPPLSPRIRLTLLMSEAGSA